MSRLSYLSFSLFMVCAGMTACGSEDVVPQTPPAPELPTGTPEAPADPKPASCAEATASYAATREPSNVLFLYDRSGSMHIKLPSNETRWQATKKGFFDLLAKLPPSTGAGLMLFPQGDAPVNAYCGIDPSVNDVRCKSSWPEPSELLRCDASKYTPSVPSNLLSPTQIQAMQDRVNASDAEFYWGTPLASALHAAIDAQRASTLPGARSVILLTDGNPTSCGEESGISNDIRNVERAAAKGLDTSKGALVRTFVIGLVDSNRQAAKAENLSPIAWAGGTPRTLDCRENDSCFYKLTDKNFADDLKDIFDEISLQAFDCTFNLPTATNGADPTTINVELSNANGSSSRVVGRDTSRTNGWDYLPNGTQIQLYGQACKEMKDSNANLRIVYGCPAITAPAPSKTPAVARD